MYLTQITLQNGIPIELKIPNEVTRKTLEESEAGKNLHAATDTDELFRELDS